jgi:hypothetical protein
MLPICAAGSKPGPLLRAKQAQLWPMRAWNAWCGGISGAGVLERQALVMVGS